LTRSTLTKVAAALAALLVLVAAWRAGVLEIFADPQRMRDYLLAQGNVGYVVFVVAFAVLQALGIPLMAFVVGAAYVWPRPVAFGLSLLGALGSASLGFLFARFVARDWVAAKLPPRIKDIDKKIGERAFLTVVIVRLIFWGNPLIHMLFGISRMRFSEYFLACLAAYIPILAAGVWASGYAIDFIKDRPISEWAPYAVAAVVVAAGVKLYRMRTRKPEEEKGEA
jgi:uncharacterized membrane protein YdjX (TVP38/TMEM64 family)